MKGEISKYTIPLFTIIPLGLNINHIAKIIPENERLIKKKQIKVFKNIFLLNLNEDKTIEIDIKTFIKNDKYLFGSGMSI